jgi:hypothetical protein
MIGKPVLREVNQYVFRDDCHYSPVACSLLALQPVCQLSDCCLSGLSGVWLYGFSLKVSCCCQVFAIQVCYCLLAQLKGVGAVYGSCTLIKCFRAFETDTHATMLGLELSCRQNSRKTFCRDVSVDQVELTR